VGEQGTSHWDDYRCLVEKHLRDALQRAGDVPASLLEAMQYTVLAPGKRLRPLLVLLAAECCGGPVEQGLPAAAAVEMVHTYSLIHDDLPAMDDDDLRRGQPTCHKKFGEPLAILAGDALLTLAFEVLARSYPPATAAVCSLELSRGAGAAGMVAGQVLDLAWERTPDPEGSPLPTLADLQNIHARKTGALFRASLRLGFWSVQGELGPAIRRDWLECLDGYGRCFGQAFQITDDLLDVEGNADLTGKRVQKDAVRGKVTYPGLLGIDESRHRAAELCRQAVQHLEPIGSAGQRLAELVQTILHRDR
jgi:geranylgeranyl diphosphate synthase type II